MTSTCPVTRCTFAEYQSIDACNWSTLEFALKSGLHYQYALANPRPSTPPMDLGRLSHTAVFEPDRLLHEYVIWDGGDKRGKDWTAFKEANEHRTIVRPTEYEAACSIRDAVRAHPVAAQLLCDGIAECVLQWIDKDTGLPCKARLDWLRYTLDPVLADLKTARDIEAHAFGVAAGRMHYHGKLAFYASGLLAHGMTAAIKIIAVENTPPFDVAVYDLGNNQQYAGECQYQQALRTVAECRRTGTWQGRYANEMALALPSWEFPTPDEEDEIFREEA